MCQGLVCAMEQLDVDITMLLPMTVQGVGGTAEVSAAWIISKTTGVGEVLHQGVLKIDFWDVDKMAEQIVEVLNNPLLGQLRNTAKNEIKQLTWDTAARKCVVVYNDVGVQAEQVYFNN